MGFFTDVIHAGQIADPTTGAVITPIYQTSTYVQDALGQHKGYEYARTHNLTRMALEKNLAILEKGYGAKAFASGMAGISAMMTTFLKSGDHVVVSDNTYGGTYRLFENILTKFGLSFSYVDDSNLDEVASSLKPTTRMIFLETPTNPIMRMCDINAIVNLVKDKDLLVVVDNTFMSPYFQHPIELGADIVIHSTTKYINGHSDSIGGIVVVNSSEMEQRLAYVQNAAGAILSPFDSWLTLRGIKTLPLRMEKHDENGRAIASYLNNHPKVQTIYYPGLESHKQYSIACKQMSGFGGMMAFDLGSLEQARIVLENVKIFALAESLGGVESLICHPSSMTHASVPEEKRKQLGITDGLVRISVGIEDLEDLMEDLESALKIL